MYTHERAALQVLKGRDQTIPLASLPAAVTVERWDGTDGTAAQTGGRDEL